MSTEVAKTQQTALETKKATSQIEIFHGNLKKYENDLKSLLSIHNIAPEKFMTLTLNAVKRLPKLLECDPKTLFGAIMVSAELGLEPNTVMGYAHILPYKRRYKEGGQWKEVLEAQYQTGYPGWLEIMYRNPKIESIDTGVIYENEQWTFDKGKREPFSHTPLSPSKRGKEWVAVFAIAWLKDAVKPKVIVLYKEEIEEFKKLSQGANSDYSPWNNTEKDPQKWMPRKTAIKQLVKELPKTKEIEKVYHIDNIVETGGTVVLDEDTRTVQTLDTGYMDDLNKQQKLDSKGENVASGVKGMMPLKEEPKPEDKPADNPPAADPSKLSPEEVAEYSGKGGAKEKEKKPGKGGTQANLGV